MDWLYETPTTWSPFIVTTGGSDEKRAQELWLRHVKYESIP